MGPCVAYCLCSRVGSVAVAVPAPTICFAPLSIVTASRRDLVAAVGSATVWGSRAAVALSTLPAFARVWTRAVILTSVCCWIWGGGCGDSSVSSGGASRTDVSVAIARRRPTPVGGAESANWGTRNSLVAAQVFWSWLCNEKYSSTVTKPVCNGS